MEDAIESTKPPKPSKPTTSTNQVATTVEKAVTKSSPTTKQRCETLYFGGSGNSKGLCATEKRFASTRFDF